MNSEEVLQGPTDKQPLLASLGLVQIIATIFAAILLLIAVGTGAYLVATRNKYPFQQIPVSTTAMPIDRRGLFPELNGFPIYPGSILIRTEFAPGCGEGAYAICNSSVYRWLTTDNFDQVRQWYVKATAQTGWHCYGGAGQYTSPREASGVKMCTKGDMLAPNKLFYEASSQSTEITLAVPVSAQSQDGASRFGQPSVP